MSDDEVKILYETDEDFKAYCDKTVSCVIHGKPLDETLKLALVKSAAEYYATRGKGL